MGCATTTVKVSSIVFNVILALIAIVAIVAVALNTENLPEEWIIPLYIIFAFIVVFALLGCGAAVRESICLTVTCAVFLLLLAILQITLTCIILNDREMQSGVETVKDAWDTNKMDALQAKYKCCGRDSPQDYVLHLRKIPDSCYPNEKAAKAASVEDLFKEGCSSKLQRYYDGVTTKIANASWVLIAFEVLGFLLALFLVINFRNKQRRMQF